ncbi:hypothetical protein KUF83_17700 [Streptomyces sp. BV286]|uniref:hypothetical protein n=1 Tax=Streptomyces sp. BV286 TaxID=2849672 RepID=UPI001C2EEDDC|nr:hypothetical protein [Streptomyces sp. BV286]MBV1938384.1 hypothetical protein [Streptomyces sp. BV286]
MTTDPHSGEADQATVRARRLPYGVASVKVIFVLALCRMFAAPMTKELLGEELLAMPTWEWSVCALTPGILIYLTRRPADWAQLTAERFFLRIALSFYFLYALAFAVFQGVGILWIAVAASIGGFAAITYLNRREQNRAH